ncbi:DNA-directed RNA polymerase III subunit RPC5 [Cimex lectularius]|uniref:DNA-directed RNA polymerase III subunit RPC5 n=1 Tax=Cimex lectularius TaxID=79782 RepID=A0A8I6TE57_CIMLE|nr:DNA-directed RNA polymerase III subunit RPC5 [Cimex lectularius]
MMSDDEDDPVIDEIPVFLTHDLSENLFVYQYPVQPAASVGKYNVIKSQIKPENQEVVLEVSLDTQNANYDKAQGEHLAQIVDKDKPASSRTYPMKIMDKIKLESKKANINRDNFAIGVMNRRQLILSPIRGIVSMFPTFSHKSNQESDQKEDETKNKEEARLVHVQFAQVETEKSKKARESSYNYYCEKASNEPWYSTKYHEDESPLAKFERERLCCVGTQRKFETPMELSCESYLDNLLPKEVETNQDIPELPDHLTSINSLKELSEQDQVRKVLDQVKVTGAIQLSWLLSMDLDKVVQCLQTCAVLVLGNWVLRSDLLYRGPKNGIPQEVMANSRDYILHEFHQGRTLERKNLGSVIALPFEEVKEIMSQVGVLKRNKLWQFRLQPDGEFMKRYPDVVEQQNLLWKVRMRDIEEHFGFITPGQAAPQNQRRRNNSESSTTSTTQASPHSASRRRKNSSVSSDDSSEPTAAPRRRNRKKNESKSAIIMPTDIKIKEEPPS